MAKRARIYQPAKTAMQSGTANTRYWVVEFAPEAARRIEPLMGWVGSTDTDQQVRMRFPTRDEAVSYAERMGLIADIEEPQTRPFRPKSYAANFASDRYTRWTH